MVDIAPKIQVLLLLPPGVIIAVALIGFLIQIRWFLFGTFVVVLSIAALLVLSLPLTGYQFMQGIESRFPPLRLNAAPEAGPAAGAIVILGGGRYTDAAEYGGGDTVNRWTLERLRYGVYLHRLTGLPILVSGGATNGAATPEAELMQAALIRDFGVEATWMEDKSANTYENAKYTKAILDNAGIRRVYLVTHAVHMPRAVWAFENAGINTIPAPMGFTTLDKEEREMLGYFPSVLGLQLSRTALRELLGLMWYQHKYGGGDPTAEAPPAPAH